MSIMKSLILKIQISLKVSLPMVTWRSCMASSKVGRSGCSLNYYSNELAVIRDPKKRIFIQILFYPYGHSKVTLGVNAPFLQFAYSPLRENIKITEKISIKSDEGRTKIAEIEIDDFAQDKIDNYILSFLRDTIMFNS